MVRSSLSTAWRRDDIGKPDTTQSNNNQDIKYMSDLVLLLEKRKNECDEKYSLWYMSFEYISADDCGGVFIADITMNR